MKVCEVDEVFDRAGIHFGNDLRCSLSHSPTAFIIRVNLMGTIFRDVFGFDGDKYLLSVFVDFSPCTSGSFLPNGLGVISPREGRFRRGSYAVRCTLLARVRNGDIWTVIKDPLL